MKFRFDAPAVDLRVAAFGLVVGLICGAIVSAPLMGVVLVAFGMALMGVKLEEEPKEKVKAA